MVTLAWMLGAFAFGCLLTDLNWKWKVRQRNVRTESYLEAHERLDD